jgi:carboxymethylenebutenolidase
MDIEVKRIDVPRPGGAVECYVASPVGRGSWPCILVVHEVYGIRGHVDDVCNRLARMGCHVVAPMLFSRYGDVHALTDFGEIHAVSKAVPDHEVIADLDTVFEASIASGRVDATRMGITGFCWGGRQVWLYAEHNPRLRAGVAWYGGQIDAEPTPLRPRNPIDIAASVKPPVLGLYGGADAIISLESIQDMQRKLADAGSPSRIEIFPDAQHGFHAEIRKATFHPQAAARGWDMMVGWFNRHGVGPLETT